MKDRNYTGPSAAGAPRNVVPDWLDHTANAQENIAYTDNLAPNQDPGPNAVGVVSSTGTVAWGQ